MFLLACAEPSPASFAGHDLLVEATSAEAAQRVSWTTNEVASGRVECASPDDDPREVPAQSADGLHHEVLLAGLGAGLSWSCRALAETDAASWSSEDFVVEQPAEPSDLSALVLAEGSDVEREGFVVLATAGAGQPGSVSVVDHHGRRTWWKQASTEDVVCDAQVALDGRGVWWMSMGESPWLRYDSFDGEEEVLVEAPGMNHAFDLLPDGSLVVVAYDVRMVDDKEIWGDQLLHIGADGSELGSLWSVWDEYAPTDEQVPDESPIYEWSHLNAVSYDEAAELYVVTSLGWNAVLGVDAATGQTEWMLGGDGDQFDFSTVEAEHIPNGIHGAVLSEHGVALFNNRSDPDDPWSEGLEYEIDWESGAVDVRWSAEADRAVYVPMMGNVEALGGGEWLVGYGVAGRVVEHDEEAGTLWQIDAELGAPNGYAHAAAEVAGATR